AVLESEKATAEIESSADGVLLETYVDEGEEIAIDVGTPLAVVGEAGETVPSLDSLDDTSEAEQDAASDQVESAANRAESGTEASTRDDAAGAVKATPRAKREAQENDVDLHAVEGTGPQGAITADDVHEFRDAQDTGDDAGTDADVKATPRAKRAARERGVPLGAIDGTGPQGAVTADDVERYAESSAGGAATGEGGTAESSGAGDLTVVESNALTGTRKTIAERLSQSAREKPHVMGTREIGLEQLERVQDRLAEVYDVDVSLNDLLLHFVGRVLEDLPQFNAHFEDGQHELIDEVNVGYAVDGPRGLTVPVVEDVTGRSLADLAAHRRERVQRVLDDEHTAADLQGGTFTITNVGVFGIDVSYSIINPPEVAILAVGRRKYAPVERDGDVDFEKVITCSLTIDHRVLDGADSGAFLDRLAEYVEYPGSVLDAVSEQ
ncbi:MAG TPA: dihydrolipoamide acetyltransferase family protein, partial [Halobacteriales archaeon]|nr:dihydrolipoamide acetyltransferase family protein [Halobacteriales archaeon]